MSEDYGFFTSVSGDRKYNAAFMNRRLHEALQREEGVLSCDGALEVSLAGTLLISVATGAAMKGGIYYRNSSSLSLGLDAPNVGMKRRDRIVIHIDRYLRTMKATVVKGTESTTPLAPAYSLEDDVTLAQVLLERSDTTTVITITDERMMRPVFLTNKNSIDHLAEGQIYGRVLKAKAEAINAGQMDLSFRKFIFVAKGLTDDRRITALTLLPDGTTMLMGTSGLSNLWRSSDFGITWTLMPGITVDTEVNSIAINGNAILVAGGSPARMYRCAYLGGPWTLVAENTDQEFFSTFLVIDSMTMLAGCDHYVYRSVDGGLTWALQGNISGVTYIKAMESLGNGVILAAGYGGNYISRSTDSGATWTDVKRLDYVADRNMFIKYLGNGIVLFGYSENGKVHRSTDYGLTWDSGITLEDRYTYTDLLIDGNTLWLPVYNSLYVSENAGASWTKKHASANASQIYKLCKNSNGVIITIGGGGYAFWGYEFNV